MAENIDMSEPVVIIRRLGDEYGFCTDYLENYIAELVESINDLTTRVEALESP